MKMEVKPPRRISQAPSARNLQPRRVSAVRRWPPACGRFPSPSPSPSPSHPPSPPATLTATATVIPPPVADLPPPPAANGRMDFKPGAVLALYANIFTQTHTQTADKEKKDKENKDEEKNYKEKNDKETYDKEVKKVDSRNKRWMNSKVYPPPKRRPVSAIRRYPPRCGRAPHFCLGLVSTISHKTDRPHDEAEHPIKNSQSRNDAMDQNDDHNHNDELSPQISVPLEENANHNSLHSDNQIAAVDAVQKGTADDSKSKLQQLPDDKKQDSKPYSGEGVSRKEPGCEVVSMDGEPLLNDSTAESDIVARVIVHKPTSEGLCGKTKKIKAKKKPDKISDVKKPKSEQVTDIPSFVSSKVPDQNDGIPGAENGMDIDLQPSKEMVVFSENMPRKDKSASSKGKEKVVFKKKVVAKKNVTPKLGRKYDNDTVSSEKDTRPVPFLICNDEDATMGPSMNEDVIPSQIRSDICAKKSVSGPSRPSLTECKQKKKERKDTKKSARPFNDDSPSKQQPNLMTLTLPPVAPSDGERLSSARSKVKKILRLFQVVCRMLIRNEESGSGKQSQKDETASQSKPKGPNRIDLKAVEFVKKSDEYVDPGDPVVGHLPGIEVGDEFRYRVELHLIGLHRPLQSGIDWTKVNGVPVATSIVASGGYSDGMDGSDVLNYTGAGGKPTGKKGKRSKPEDQKLERGNLALKNSMDMKTPVRVIHGLNTSDTSKVVMTFTYDGLYMVEEVKSEIEMYKYEGQEYKVKVFRYRLRRMPGQPELGLHVATKSKKSKVREGLCVPDISQGMEKIPICAINTIDEEKPPAFKYITNMIYPSWYEKTAPKGCDCTGKCSSSKRCLCALKNGGEIPFNFSGAIVQAKQLIYECGPSCRCPPSCHNRVSQNGIKIPLEIFKTKNRGWGVRSLSSIPSGSFVCEYVGELLRDEVAERRGNDEYLFDIGHNYDDADLWKGLPSLVSGIGSTGDCGASASEGLTIDAAEMGNVGRFINHCCSPNLYAQNVLFDHDDRRMPHIMFFAAENIPPLQELTYHYNYDIGQVRDSQGNVKIKKCYCGSSECEGRLY